MLFVLFLCLLLGCSYVRTECINFVLVKRGLETPAIEICGPRRCLLLVSVNTPCVNVVNVKPEQGFVAGMMNVPTAFPSVNHSASMCIQQAVSVQ